MSPNSEEKFIVKGLSGQQSLHGQIRVHGAKNAALKAMAASLLFDGPVNLENIPDNKDVGVMSNILEKLGAKITKKSSDSYIIDPSSISTNVIDSALARNMRSSIVLTGPLLSRFGAVSFPAPGGCVIGVRPIDLFIDGYKKMGATVDESDSAVYKIQTSTGLQSTEIFFNIQSVGGTETLMMAAVLAKGKTILNNCAMEPEIVNVAEWLNAAGAKIRGVGTTTIEIEGTGGKLLNSKISYKAIPDRIEAGSFLILGALCAKELTITECRPDHLESIINLLRNSGVKIEIKSSNIIVQGVKDPKSFDIRTHEYPGFPTDLQAPMVTYLTQASGESIVFETIFEGRFKYTEDLAKIGAHITVMNPREILIKGPTPFSELIEEELRAHDIRAGFAIVMAALCGKGTYTIHNVNLIDRGYERLEEVLTSIGADVKRVKS